jgi:NitT/TauT family transport system substrate-binding protein
MQNTLNRRVILSGLSAAGATTLLNISSSNAAGESPPETIKVRLPRWIGGAYCWAAPYIAGELLKAEGFKVFYFQGDPNFDHSVWIADGQTDFSINYPAIHIASIEAGVPIKVLAGLHSGCLELIANNYIHRVADLRGKRVGVDSIGGASHVHLSLMAAYVGLDPAKDIEWVVQATNPAQLFIDGKVDAFLGTPPQPQELRAKNIGHVIVDTTTDTPWSQHYCCMISATSNYVDKYPIATKRILRAMFKAADLCASDPASVAQRLVEQNFVTGYDYAFQTLGDIRYDRWREYDPEASLRFYALRMLEIGMIQSSPQQIIADGTDWRFLNELKHELKT